MFDDALQGLRREEPEVMQGCVMSPASLFQMQPALQVLQVRADARDVGDADEKHAAGIQ